jgi:hypothetical protein
MRIRTVTRSSGHVLRRALLLICLVLPLTIVGSAEGATGTGWMIWSDAPSGLGGAGIGAVGVSDVWAATEHGGVQHWNGTSWEAPKAIPGTAVGAVALSGVTSSDVWAVGFQVLGNDSPGNYSPLAAHWTGASWATTTTPDPGANGVLEDVDASASGNVWAVGNWYDATANGGAGGQRALAMQWNGTSWAEHDGSGAFYWLGFNAVSVLSASDVWAAGVASTDGSLGGPLVEHWNGSSWSQSFFPASGLDGARLYDIYAVSSTNVWAVGSDATNQGLIEHFNGTSWARVTIPGITDQPASQLFAIDGTSGADIWAGGLIENQVGSTLILHYNGTGWTRVPSPNMDGFGGGSTIRKLSVVSPSLAYATAGDTSGSYLDRYGSGDFTSSFASLQASQTPGQMGQPNTFNGQLDFSEHASPLGATIHLTRTNPDQSQTPLADATADLGGGFSFQDTPPIRGSYTYTASYDGDQNRTGAQAQATLDVQGLATTLKLTPSKPTIPYQGTVTLTALLGPHLPGASVKILKTSVTGRTTTLAEGLVAGDGIFVAQATLTKNATFQAVFSGDATYDPRTSKPVPIGVRVKITGVETGWYAKSGSYRLYHFRSACSTNLRYCPAYTVTVKPNKAGRRVHMVLQLHTQSGWRTIGDAWAKLNTKSMTTIRVHYANDTRIIGKQFREHAAYQADTENAGAISSWAYFTITR